MVVLRFLIVALQFTVWTAVTLAQSKVKTLAEQRQALLERISQVHGLGEQQRKALESIFGRSQVIGQGNPQVTQHPMTLEQCQEKISKSGVEFRSAQNDQICGHAYMAPIYTPGKQKPEDAQACIDQFEFPNVPCEYPVVWVKANEAAEICEAMGKRLCDAHEWEDACQGEALGPEYDFELAAKMSEHQAIKTMRSRHNLKHGQQKKWAYGSKHRKGICGANSTKASDCNGGDWKRCGSNTYPAGAFPECKSPLGVYDQHGNAAEHMNLPVKELQLASQPSRELGHTEMKGSWFIFDKFQAHEDWCRWRAPYWHGTKVKDQRSHHNYHLGFRCCSETKAKPALHIQSPTNGK